MLQLWRPRPPCQRVQVTTPAQEVPFLSEHRPHGGQLPSKTSAVLTRFSGKTISLEGRRRGAYSLGGASRMLQLRRKSGNTVAKGSTKANQTALILRWAYDPLLSFETTFGKTSGLKNAHRNDCFCFKLVGHVL